jgi:hypothetical protein
MQLGLTVLAVVLVITVVLGAAGYFIDRSAARRDRPEAR